MGAATDATPMSAHDVAEALTKRWPESDYLHVREAPLSADRQGIKIDVLVVSLWQSRGLERDAVEIKISASDWKRELKKPEKADAWWRYAHRFWIATPLDLAVKIRDEIPTGWGLLAVTATGTKEIVKPAKQTPRDLPWGACVGLMRASAAAGPMALQRAEQAGYSRGHKAAENQAAQRVGSGWSDQQAAELRELNLRASKFRDLTGIDLRSDFRPLEAEAELIALARAFALQPAQVRGAFTRAADDLRKKAQGIEDTLGVLMGAISESSPALEEGVR